MGNLGDWALNEGCCDELGGKMAKCGSVGGVMSLGLCSPFKYNNYHEVIE